MKVQSDKKIQSLWNKKQIQNLLLPKIMIAHQLPKGQTDQEFLTRDSHKQKTKALEMWALSLIEKANLIRKLLQYDQLQIDPCCQKNHLRPSKLLELMNSITLKKQWRKNLLKKRKRLNLRRKTNSNKLRTSWKEFTCLKISIKSNRQ